MTLASNDPSGPIAIPLNGTGTPALGLEVTVDGGPTASLNVKQGATASFLLAVTPLGGFQGPVALTCTSESPGPYAVCSLLQSKMNLSGESGASSGSITTLGPVRSSGAALGSLLCALPLLLARRRGQPRALATLALALSIVLCTASGCGGPGSTGSPLTPRGTYHYNVTATAAGTTPLSASATITLVVE